MVNKDKEKKSLMEQYRESQESAFIREVKAEATRERFEKIWHKHKYIIIAVVALPILISLAVNMYDSRSRRISQEEAAAYSELASIADDATRIDKAIDFASTARSVYRDVAYQAIYSAQLAQGKKEAAIATLRIAIRNARDASFRSAAIIKLVLEPSFEDNKEKARLLGTNNWPPRSALSYSSPYSCSDECARRQGRRGDKDSGRHNERQERSVRCS